MVITRKSKSKKRPAVKAAATKPVPAPEPEDLEDDVEDEPDEEPVVPEPVVEEGERKITWLNKGGTHYLRAGTDNKGKPRIKRIKPGERFKAYPSQIKEAHRDKIVPVEPIVELGLTAVRPAYEAISSELNPNQWNVLDVNRKKIINQKPLSKVEAEKYIKDLME